MDDDLRRPSHGGSVRVGDEDRLAELGYKQELQRNWSLLHNFGVSFSIIVSASRLPSRIAFAFFIGFLCAFSPPLELRRVLVSQGFYFPFSQREINNKFWESSRLLFGQ